MMFSFAHVAVLSKDTGIFAQYSNVSKGQQHV